MPVDWKYVLMWLPKNAHCAGRGRTAVIVQSRAARSRLTHGKDYDAVLVTNFLHHSSLDNVVLLKKIGAALRPGGQIVILEFAPSMMTGYRHRSPLCLA